MPESRLIIGISGGKGEAMESTGGPKICLIGAGGMSFGPVMVLDAVHTRRLRGATLMLHDVSPERLEVARRFAERVNGATGRPITIEASTDPAEAHDRRRLLPDQRRGGALAALGRGLRDPLPPRADPDHR